MTNLPLGKIAQVTRSVLARVSPGLVLFGGITIANCTPNAPPPTNPVDLSVPPLAADASAPIVTPSSSKTCTGKLVAGSLQKSMTECFIDEKITKGPGTLIAPCTGDGPVEAAFGEAVYRGTIKGSVVHLELETELDWQDGCRWGMRSTIDGIIGRGPLEWQYEERVLRGKRCFGPPCTAETTIAVSK